METPEFSGRIKPPELDINNPSEMFAIAKKMERWARFRVKPVDRITTIDGFIDDLERYVSDVFDGILPEVVVRGHDITYNVGVSEVERGEYRMRTAQLPLRGDAELYGRHMIQGVLYGFHRGVRNDMRLFVSQQDEPVITPGGLILPMLSVGLAGSEIKLADDNKHELLKPPLKYVSDHLIRYGQETFKDVGRLTDVLNAKEGAIKDKLLDSSAIIVKIEKQSDPTSQFIDNLLEIIRIKLDLISPQDLQARQRRVIYIDHETVAFKIVEGETLKGATVELELTGVDDRTLSLHYIDKDQQAIQVPVRDIMYIHKSKPKLL